MIVKGFPSKDFVHSAARAISWRQKPAFIYYCGDVDPSGLKIWEGYAPDADVNFDRLAVNREQVQEYSLQTRPTKREGNPHAKNFSGESVEVDALPIDVLQQLVREAIERHIDQRQLAITKEAEASEMNWRARATTSSATIPRSVGRTFRVAGFGFVPGFGFVSGIASAIS